MLPFGYNHVFKYDLDGNLIANAKYGGNAIFSGDLHLTPDGDHLMLTYTLNDDLTIRKMKAADLTVYNEDPVWYDVSDAIRYAVMPDMILEDP